MAVAAAIEIADESGLDAVTMAAVAKRCGFTTMSLYRHVASKDDLMRRMLDVVLGTPPPFDTSDWRAGLAAWSQAMLDVLARHPWGIDIPITGKLDTHAQLAWLDRGLEAMASTGLHEGDKAEIVLVLNGFVFWSARLRPSIPEDPARRSSRPRSTSRPTPRWWRCWRPGSSTTRRRRRRSSASGSNSSSTASRPRSGALSCGSGSARSGSGRSGPSSRRRPSR